MIMECLSNTWYLLLLAFSILKFSLWRSFTYLVKNIPKYLTFYSYFEWNTSPFLNIDTTIPFQFWELSPYHSYKVTSRCILDPNVRHKQWILKSELKECYFFASEGLEIVKCLKQALDIIQNNPKIGLN